MAQAVPLILLAAGTVVTAYGQHQAGRAQDMEAKRQAEQEKVAATDREIDRKRRLLKALAARNVQAGASGATLAGTPQALAMGDINQFQSENRSDAATTSGRAEGLRTFGRNARAAGNTAAIGSLLQGAGAATSLMSFGGGLKPVKIQGAAAKRM